MTSRRKNFHTFNERQHCFWLFICWLFLFFEFKFLKKTLWQSKHWTEWPFQKCRTLCYKRCKILWQKHHVYSFILICRFKCFSLSTKYSYLSLSKPIIDTVDICNRMPRVVSPSSLLKQVFISFILENKCSTQATPRGSINDNFNKRKKLEQKKKKL